MLQIACFKTVDTIVKASGEVVLFPCNLGCDLFFFALTNLLKVVAQ